MHYPAIEHEAPFFQQILQALVISLPMATGVSPVCSMPEPLHQVGSILQFFPTSANPTACMIIQGSWAIGAVLLWSCAIIGPALFLYKTYKRSGMPVKHWLLQDRREKILQSARLMLLMSAGISFIMYMISSPAALYPRSTSRYLACLLLAMPAVLWPLWNGLRKREIVSDQRIKHSVATMVIRWIILCSIIMAFALGTWRIREEIPYAQAVYNQQVRLTQDLLHLGATRIYSDYWTCARLIFQSQENIICASLDDQLHPDNDRYPAYRIAVASVHHPAYVFSVGSAQANTFEQKNLASGTLYQKHVLDGYSVYMPYFAGSP
jgi:hypothetical protein